MLSSLCLSAALVATTPAPGAASATAPAELESAAFTSARHQRRLGLTLATVSYGLRPPLFGAQLQYHLSDRLAIGAQLTGAFLVADLSAHARGFLLADQTSGFYADAGAHAVGTTGMAAFGGTAELGYQYRSFQGFLLEVGLAVAVLYTIDEEAEPPPGRAASGQPWSVLPTFNLRIGYAF
jgi:hypothetical protein